MVVGINIIFGFNSVILHCLAITASSWTYFQQEPGKGVWLSINTLFNNIVIIMTGWNLQVVLLSSSEIWICRVNQSHKPHQTLDSRTTKVVLSGVILETEGSLWKIQNSALFYYKKVKDGTPNLTFPNVRSLFAILLIKQFFIKNKSLAAASGSRTQF